MALLQKPTRALPGTKLRYLDIANHKTPLYSGHKLKQAPATLKVLEIVLEVLYQRLGIATHLIVHLPHRAAELLGPGQRNHVESPAHRVYDPPLSRSRGELAWW